MYIIIVLDIYTDFSSSENYVLQFILIGVMEIFYGGGVLPIFSIYICAARMPSFWRFFSRWPHQKWPFTLNLPLQILSLAKY